MEAHEHEYGRQVQPGSNTLGFFVFSPEMHPKHTVKQRLLHLSLPGSYTDTAPATGCGREKGLQTSLGKRIITITQISILPRPPGFATSNNSPADGSGKLKSSQLSSLPPMAAYTSQQIQFLQYGQNQQLLPGPRWLSSCFEGNISFFCSLLPWACFRGKLRQLTELQCWKV